MNDKKNPFRKLETEEELPENLKDKVMTSVNLGMLMVDFAELFTAKAGQAALELFNVEERKDDQESDQADDKQSQV